MCGHPLGTAERLTRPAGNAGRDTAGPVPPLAAGSLHEASFRGHPGHCHAIRRTPALRVRAIRRRPSAGRPRAGRCLSLHRAAALRRAGGPQRRPAAAGHTGVAGHAAGPPRRGVGAPVWGDRARLRSSARPTDRAARPHAADRRHHRTGAAAGAGRTGGWGPPAWRPPPASRGWSCARGIPVRPHRITAAILPRSRRELAARRPPAPSAAAPPRHRTSPWCRPITPGALANAHRPPDREVPWKRT